MSRGQIRMDDGSIRSYGFSGIYDWIDSVIHSFPAPWKVAELSSKYYGTIILDSAGTPILEVWMSWGMPSDREVGAHGGNYESWRENLSDEHWESAISLSMSELIVVARNHCFAEYVGFTASDDSEVKLLRDLVCNYSQWHESVWHKIRCGGPDQRILDGDPAMVNRKRSGK